MAKTHTYGDIEIVLHDAAVIIRNKRSKASLALSREEAHQLMALLVVYLKSSLLCDGSLEKGDQTKTLT